MKFYFQLQILNFLPIFALFKLADLAELKKLLGHFFRWSFERLHFRFELDELLAILVHDLFVLFKQFIISKLIFQLLKFDSQICFCTFALIEHFSQIIPLFLQLQIILSQFLNLIFFAIDVLLDILQVVRLCFQLYFQLIILFLEFFSRLRLNFQLFQNVLHLIAFTYTERMYYRSKLCTGFVIQDWLEVKYSSLLKTGSFLAIWASPPILKMLRNAVKMEAVSTCKRGQVLVELVKANRTGGDLIQILNWIIFRRRTHWRLIADFLFQIQANRFDISKFGKIIGNKFYSYAITQNTISQKQQYTMGCTPVKRHTHLERRDTQIGILTVSLIGLHLHDMPKQAHPNLKIRVSNQHFTISNIHLIGGSSMKVQQNTSDTFNFVINSFYKACGRSLQIGYFSDDTILYYGAFDLNIIIEHKGEHQFRCILTDRHAERGYVLARAYFEPLPYYELNFRFETATIRSKVSSQSVAVRISIGQEILQTQYQKDIPQSPPYWEDKKYNFKVPKIVVKGYLQLINQLGDIIGRAQIILENLYCVKEGEEILQSQELFSREKESQIVVADLKYSFMLGKSINFMPRTGQLTSTITGKRYRNEGQTQIRSSGNE